MCLSVAEPVSRLEFHRILKSRRDFRRRATKPSNPAAMKLISVVPISSEYRLVVFSPNADPTPVLALGLTDLGQLVPVVFDPGRNAFVAKSQDEGIIGQDLGDGAATAPES